MAVSFEAMRDYRATTRTAVAESAVAASELADARATEVAALEAQVSARKMIELQLASARTVQRAFRGYLARRFTMPRLREELRQLARWSMDAVFEATVRRQIEFGIAVDDALRRRRMQRERRRELRATLQLAAKRVGEAAMAMRGEVVSAEDSFLAVVAAMRDKAAMQAVLSGAPMAGAGRGKRAGRTDDNDDDEEHSEHRRTRVDLAAMLRALELTGGGSGGGGVHGGRAELSPTVGPGGGSSRRRRGRGGGAIPSGPGARHGGAGRRPGGAVDDGLDEEEDDDLEDDLDDDATSVVERLDDAEDLDLTVRPQAGGGEGAPGGRPELGPGDAEAAAMSIAAALRDAAELGALLDPEVARLSAGGASVALVEDRGFYFREGVSEGAFLSLVRDCGLWGNRVTLSFLHAVFARRCVLAADHAAVVHARRQFSAHCDSGGRLPRERVGLVVSGAGLPVPAAEASDWASRQPPSIAVESFVSWFQERRAQAKATAAVSARDPASSRRGGDGGDVRFASSSLRRRLGGGSSRVAGALESAGHVSAGGRTTDDALYGALADGHPPPSEALLPLCCLARDGFEKALADVAMVVFPSVVTRQRPPMDFDDALILAGQDPDGAPVAGMGAAAGSVAPRGEMTAVGMPFTLEGGRAGGRAGARFEIGEIYGPEPPSAVSLLHTSGSKSRREGLDRLLRERIAPSIHQMEVLGCWGLTSPAGALLQSEGVRNVLREYEPGLLTVFGRYAEAPVLATSSAGRGIARRAMATAGRGPAMVSYASRSTLQQSPVPGSPMGGQTPGLGGMPTPASSRGAAGEQEDEDGEEGAQSGQGWVPSAASGADDLNIPGGHARTASSARIAARAPDPPAGPRGSGPVGGSLASKAAAAAAASAAAAAQDAEFVPPDLLSAPSFLMRSEMRTDDPGATAPPPLSPAASGGRGRVTSRAARARAAAGSDTSAGQAAGMLRTSARIRYSGWRRLCLDFGLSPGLLANGVEDGFELLSCLLCARARDRVGTAHECVYPPVALFGARRRRCAKCGRAEYRWAYDEQVAARAAFREWTSRRPPRGRLDKAELRDMLRAVGRDVSPRSAAFRLMLAVMDEDGDGLVDIDEFMAGLSAAEAMAQTARGAAATFPELCVALAVASRLCMSKPSMQQHLPPSPPPATQLRFLLSHVMEPVYRAATGSPMRRTLSMAASQLADPGLPQVEAALSRELGRAHFLYSRIDGEVTGERLDASRFLLFARDVGLFRCLPAADVMRVYVAAATERLRAGEVLDQAVGVASTINTGVTVLDDVTGGERGSPVGGPSSPSRLAGSSVPPAPIRRPGGPPPSPLRSSHGGSSGRLRPVESFRVMADSETAANRILRGTKAVIGPSNDDGVRRFRGRGEQPEAPGRSRQQQFLAESGLGSSSPRLAPRRVGPRRPGATGSAPEDRGHRAAASAGTDAPEHGDLKSLVSFHSSLVDARSAARGRPRRPEGARPGAAQPPGEGSYRRRAPESLGVGPARPRGPFGAGAASPSRSGSSAPTSAAPLGPAAATLAATASAMEELDSKGLPRLPGSEAAAQVTGPGGGGGGGGATDPDEAEPVRMAMRAGTLTEGAFRLASVLLLREAFLLGQRSVGQRDARAWSLPVSVGTHLSPEGLAKRALLLRLRTLFRVYRLPARAGGRLTAGRFRVRLDTEGHKVRAGDAAVSQARSARVAKTVKAVTSHTSAVPRGAWRAARVAGTKEDDAAARRQRRKRLLATAAASAGGAALPSRAVGTAGGDSAGAGGVGRRASLRQTRAKARRGSVVGGGVALGSGVGANESTLVWEADAAEAVGGAAGVAEATPSVPGRWRDNAKRLARRSLLATKPLSRREATEAGARPGRGRRGRGASEAKGDRQEVDEGWGEADGGADAAGFEPAGLSGEAALPEEGRGEAEPEDGEASPRMPFAGPGAGLAGSSGVAPSAPSGGVSGPAGSGADGPGASGQGRRLTAQERAEAIVGRIRGQREALAAEWRREERKEEARAIAEDAASRLAARDGAGTPGSEGAGASPRMTSSEGKRSPRHRLPSRRAAPAHGAQRAPRHPKPLEMEFTPAAEEDEDDGGMSGPVSPGVSPRSGRGSPPADRASVGFLHVTGGRGAHRAALPTSSAFAVGRRGGGSGGIRAQLVLTDVALRITAASAIAATMPALPQASVTAKGGGMASEVAPSRGGAGGRRAAAHRLDRSQALAASEAAKAGGFEPALLTSKVQSRLRRNSAWERDATILTSEEQEELRSAAEAARRAEEARVAQEEARAAAAAAAAAEDDDDASPSSEPTAGAGGRRASGMGPRGGGQAAPRQAGSGNPGSAVAAAGAGQPSRVAGAGRGGLASKRGPPAGSMASGQARPGPRAGRGSAAAPPPSPVQTRRPGVGASAVPPLRLGQGPGVGAPGAAASGTADARGPADADAEARADILESLAGLTSSPERLLRVLTRRPGGGGVPLKRLLRHQQRIGLPGREAVAADAARSIRGHASSTRARAQPAAAAAAGSLTARGRLEGRAGGAAASGTLGRAGLSSVSGDTWAERRRRGIAAPGSSAHLLSVSQRDHGGHGKGSALGGVRRGTGQADWAATRQAGRAQDRALESSMGALLGAAEERQRRALDARRDSGSEDSFVG